MYSAKDIANAFVSIFKYDEEGITNLKVQKLIYYAQGFSYQRFDKPLFREEIEAWERGPVVNSVYEDYAEYKNHAIDKSYIPNLDKDVERLILDVAREYGKFTTAALVGMTHKKDTPWDQFFQDDSHHIVIPKEVIRDYFINVEPTLNEPDWNASLVCNAP